MPIDVSTRLTPGWWMKHLADRMWEQRRQRRIELLENWFEGKPPLPIPASPKVKDSFERFQKRSRTNFAELVVTSLRDRVIPVGLRSADRTVDADDAQDWELWQNALLDVTQAEVHRWAMTHGRTYVVVGPVDAETGAPTITHEPLSCAITEQDPVMPSRSLAGLKFKHDAVAQVDRLYLYLPGQIWLAQQPCEGAGCARNFSPDSWDWVERDATASGAPIVDGLQTLPPALSGSVLMVKFRGEHLNGVLWPHLDHFERINHGLLDRMAIAAMQAFRQRGIKGLPTHYPDDYPDKNLAGKEIDYDEIFVNDPGAFWQLPDSADVWESAQVDLGPILNATKADITTLAAVTRTPMHMLDPDGVNQSAEGASLAREGQVFNAGTWIRLLSPSWARVVTLGTRWLGRSGPMIRPSQVLWMPPERYSLAERADAASKLTDLPWRPKMIHILGFDPDEVDRMQTDRAADQVLDAHVAIAVAAQAGSQVALPPPTAGAPTPPVPPPAPAVPPEPAGGA